MNILVIINNVDITIVLYVFWWIYVSIFLGIYMDIEFLFYEIYVCLVLINIVK